MSKLESIEMTIFLMSWFPEKEFSSMMASLAGVITRLRNPSSESGYTLTLQSQFSQYTLNSSVWLVESLSLLLAQVLLTRPLGLCSLLCGGGFGFTVQVQGRLVGLAGGRGEVAVSLLGSLESDLTELLRTSS